VRTACATSLGARFKPWPKLGAEISTNYTEFIEFHSLARVSNKGQYLLERKAREEIAIRGGVGILFQFAWRRASRDVDASDDNDGIVIDAGQIRRAAEPSYILAMKLTLLSARPQMIATTRNR
jgi:hypothetical protein